jgi:hypothetical protein
MKKRASSKEGNPERPDSLPQKAAGTRRQRERVMTKYSIFTPEMIGWLSKNEQGKTYKEMTPLFNARFNTGLTWEQIGRRCQRSGFRRGAQKLLKVGTEKVINNAGFIYIKTSDDPKRRFGGYTGTWRLKHFIIWEAANGPVPEGHFVIFADKNKTNFDIGNLLLVSRRESLYMAKHGYFTGNAELTRANHAIAKHAIAFSDAVKRLTKSKHCHSAKVEYERFIKEKAAGRSNQV